MMPEQEIKRLNEILDQFQKSQTQLEITVGKLTERVDMMLKYITDKLEDRVKHLEDKPDTSTIVERVDKLEKVNSKLAFAVIISVIAAVMQLILK